MNLLEVDGKALLRTHGIEVPQGALWPSTPDCDSPWVVKAQIPDGKRGKRGGIIFVDDTATLPSTVNSLLGQYLGAHRIDSVYVEERLDIAGEYYFAVSIDRDLQRRVIIASPNGGVDIESVDDNDIIRLPIDPLLGWRGFHGDLIARFLNLHAVTARRLKETLESIYEASVDADADLVEVNPLAVTSDGRVVACDAKIVLDDNAYFRHPDWAQLGTPANKSALETDIAKSGAVGIEVDPDGDVVAVVSGAGLMMATLDLLSDAGLSVRCVVDLGGTVLSGGDGLRRVLAAIASACPKAVFINAFMQTALCDVFADSLADAYITTGLTGQVVVRLKGRRADIGRERLQLPHFEVHEELFTAISSITTGKRK